MQRRLLSAVLAGATLLLAFPQNLVSCPFPAESETARSAQAGVLGTDPGEAFGAIRADQLILENDLLLASWSIRAGVLRPAEVQDKAAGKSWDVREGEAFHILFRELWF